MIRVTAACTFALVVVSLSIAAALVMRMTHGSEWRDVPGGRVEVSHGPAEIRLTLRVRRRTLATYRLFAKVRDARVNLTEAHDRGRFLVHSVLQGGTANPRVPTLILWIGARRLRLPRRTEGRLYPFAIIPVVGIRLPADDAQEPTPGQPVHGAPSKPELVRGGGGLWLGRPGRWRVEDGSMVFRSRELEATLVTRCQRHNA